MNARVLAVPPQADRVFMVLCVLRSLLGVVAPNSQWFGRVEGVVLVKHKDVLGDWNKQGVWG